LNSLEQALTPGWHGDRAAGRVSRHLELLRDVAREITPAPDRDDSPADGDDAHRRLRDLVDRLQTEAPRSGLGAATGAFVDHVAGVAERYGRNLFHCYDDDRIPSTTNGLEALFGKGKSHIRAALGAASTTNSLAQNLGADYLEALVSAGNRPLAALLAAIDEVSCDAYSSARQAIEINERPARLRRSRRRKPVRHLCDLLDRWERNTDT
jgi:hypothetical protein